MWVRRKEAPIISEAYKFVWKLRCQCILAYISWILTRVGGKKKKKASKKSVPVSVRVMPGTEGSELRVQAPFSI